MMPQDMRGGRLSRRLRSTLGRLLSLLLLAGFFSILSSKFFSFGNLFNILRQTASNGILSFGMTFVILTGGIDLSVGSTVAVACSLIAGLLADGLPVIAAILLTLTVGFAIGLINGLIVTRMRLPAFIATMAMMTICRGLASVYTHGKAIIISNPTFLEIGNGYVGGVPLLIVYLAAAYALCWLLLYKTSFGRQIYAIGDNRDTAKFIGVNIPRVESLAYAISGVMASVVGVIYASRMYSGQPLAGEGAELDAVAAVVVGGTSLSGGSGALSGTLIGAMVIGVLNNGLNMVQVQSYWQQVCKGVVIILAVYIDIRRREKH